MPKSKGWSVACVMLALGVGCLSEATARPQDGRPIVVSTTDELKAALVGANAGRRILVRAGTYSVDRALTVPDGATLQGEGVMMGDDLPAGFAPQTETHIAALSSVAGNFLTLGNGASVQGLVVEDVVDRVGNAIAVVSRDRNDSVGVSILECEIVDPNPTRPAGPDGPNGGAIAALTLNLAFGDDPAPHAGAAVAVEIRRSIVRAAGRALFAMNFASRGRVEVDLTQNVVRGTLEAFGGISRPDVVVDAATTVDSAGNIYAPPDSPGFGWLIGGGSSAPIPFPTAGTKSSHVRVSSTDDRIEGARIGIFAFAARRQRSIDGPNFDNTAELQVRGLVTRTTGTDAADFVLHAARTGFEGSTPDREFVPGDRNVLTANVLDSSGSGLRANQYLPVFGPLLPENFGEGNRLAFLGTRARFDESNDGIDPPPDADLFTGDR
jgi:hypothetical protein